MSRRYSCCIGIINPHAGSLLILEMSCMSHCYIYGYINRREWPNGQIYRSDGSFNPPTRLLRDIHRCRIKFAYNRLRSSSCDILQLAPRPLVTMPWPRAFQQSKLHIGRLSILAKWFASFVGRFRTSTRSAFRLTSPARYCIFRRFVRGSFTLLPFSSISRIPRHSPFFPVCAPTRPYVPYQ